MFSPSTPDTSAAATTPLHLLDYRTELHLHSAGKLLFPRHHRPTLLTFNDSSIDCFCAASSVPYHTASFRNSRKKANWSSVNWQQSSYLLKWANQESRSVWSTLNTCGAYMSGIVRVWFVGLWYEDVDVGADADAYLFVLFILSDTDERVQYTGVLEISHFRSESSTNITSVTVWSAVLHQTVVRRTCVGE